MFIEASTLFKRIAGELMDGFNLKLIDYSFIYSRDNVAPMTTLSVSNGKVGCGAVNSHHLTPCDIFPTKVKKLYLSEAA